MMTIVKKPLKPVPPPLTYSSTHSCRLLVTRHHRMSMPKWRVVIQQNLMRIMLHRTGDKRIRSMRRFKRRLKLLSKKREIKREKTRCL